MNDTLIRTDGLCKYFFLKGEGILRRQRLVLKAVDQVNVSVVRGETLALVGESGSGKTTLGKTMIRIYRPTIGSIWFDNQDISAIDQRRMRRHRQHMQMVFQNPTSALNPRRIVLDTIGLPLALYQDLSRKERRIRVEDLLRMVELSPEFVTRYPHALSCGQKQRVGIARALASRPSLIVLDEPTAALDVSVQAKILKLLEQLREQYDLTYVYISHDLSVVKNIADSVAVMYLGQIVESAPTAELFCNPLHPYSRALLSAIPIVTDQERSFIPEEITLEGEIPSPLDVPLGCRFAGRCFAKSTVCRDEQPSLVETSTGHTVRCFLYR